MKGVIILILLCLFTVALANMCFAETRIDSCLNKSDFYLDKLEASGFTLEVDLDFDLGGTTYEEEASNIDSEWNGFYYGGSVSIGNYDKQDFEGKLEYGMFGTAAGTETWDVSGIEYQTNDMYFWGLDFLVEGGWAFNFENYSFTLTPLSAYGYKFIRFSRTDFNILNAITSTAVVDEDFNIHHLDIGGKIDYELNEQLNFYAKGLFGLVIYNEADNSVLGDVEGDGGYIIDTELGVNYLFTENMSLNLNGFAKLQHLEGGTSNNLIWPDNDLNAYGGSIGFKYAF